MSSHTAPSAASPSGTLTVAFALYPGCTLLDFAGATQIFAYAPGFRTVWIAATADPIHTTEGVSVLPNATFADTPSADIVFVPGGGGDGVTAAMTEPHIQQWLRTVAPNARWAGSVCTGAFVVAAAGLFDECTVTTYWSARDALALFPQLKVVPGYPRWEIDGDRRRFSGGGISSSLDLALELVIRIAGPAAAQSTQLANQYAPDPPLHSGDPTQASPELVISTTQDQADMHTQLVAAVKALTGSA